MELTQISKLLQMTSPDGVPKPISPSTPTKQNPWLSASRIDQMLQTSP